MKKIIKKLNTKITRRLLRIAAALVLLYCLLLIPGSNSPVVTKTAGKPFVWKSDALWQQLENDFKSAKQQDGTLLDSAINVLFAEGRMLHQKINPDSGLVAATDSSYSKLLSNFFSLAPLVAARPSFCDSLLEHYVQVRNTVKAQSRYWIMSDVNVRNSIYTLLYGMRAAVEEVLLQQDIKSFKPALFCKDEFSATPSATIFGIKVHSGDMLVSRGGAEVSAFIARANDYPANFSHVAIVYVDEKTNTPYIIESHIEKGVAVSTVDEYERDKKLRFMVLRPAADLAALKQNTLLPHMAAKYAYDEAMKRHIPYDFKMNFYDSSAMFCSEVGSYAYRKNGVQLWQAVSTISSPGVVNWLHDFGVENFVTQMPGDLEYDPQLSVVAEWRDPETLFNDHVDNAITDGLLELADNGKQIDYNRWMLPFIRVIKGWCIIKNMFGGVGIIPEGMSATQALKNQSYNAMFARLKQEMELQVSEFIVRNGYKPPYWVLVSLARNTAVEKLN